ncbi:MAG TPA: AAA family ATPase [Methanocorpusculum sp.]|nr:AAA family ATPase [Methanocorpusculum sp.]
MKLLRCHIENFGVLSNFDFDFSSGLTVIYRENGFGKSTFAAFIKAMFYGMPRGGSRSVVENERKRYDPWQGGKYGGCLEFEYQETRYRVTRYFGKTASKDTFQIMDISNRQNITPFSERLGEELFQLDAESFSRSTYMPQLSAHDLKATTSIRTKLSNLVDNTNDLNNFDTATESLRQFRTKFRAYRGSSGVINDLETKYNTLEHQKYEAEKEKPRLQDVSGEIERLSFEKETNTAVVSDLREKIRVASAQKSLQLLQDQLADLSTTVDLQKQSLSELDDSYPAGYPTLEEIKIQRDNLSISQQASQRLEKLTLPEADRITVEKGKILFSDIDKASQDIDTCNQICNELTEVSAKLTSQMFPE